MSNHLKASTQATTGLAGPHPVTVFMSPGCVQCHATLRALNRYQIAHTVVDVSTDPKAADRLEALGYLRAPVVVVGADHWGGYRPDKLAALRPVY